MEALLKTSAAIERLLTVVGRIAAWAGVLLITVTIFDVVTRRFLVLGSTKLQELEWHFHTVLFVLVLGWAYLRGAHVRIDLVRERLPERTRWWLELLGCLCFLIPYCVLVTWFAVDFTVRSYDIGEISASATGLSHRWIIKATIPIGFSLLALSGIAVVLRKLIMLFGPAELRERARPNLVSNISHEAPIVRD